MVKNAQDASQESALHGLFRAISRGERATVTGLLASAPMLAQLQASTGATRDNASSFFLKDISHYAYAGDTALHVAAAAYAIDIARELSAGGALIRAVNRRGAEPLHYAADGIPGSPHWKPDAQANIIRFLVNAGADPNARDAEEADHRTPSRSRCPDFRPRCQGQIRCRLRKIGLIRELLRRAG